MPTDASLLDAATHEGARRRQIITPEGVAVPVDLADRGDRAAALLIDLSIIAAALIALFLLAFAAALGSQLSGWHVAFVLVASFALRSFYFVVFELHWQGRTPGKRLMKLRVIDRGGGPLRADAVFARNLMREVEVYVPASLIIAGIDGWATLLNLVWIGAFVLMPFFNRDRLRVGDMVGGTWVITDPKAVLLPDMAAAAAGAGGAAPAYRFTDVQLDVYGVLELQTLEDVLRRQGVGAADTQREVCARIRRKIDWSPQDGEPVDALRFLEAFYAALRNRLETRMLFGQRRASQHDRH